MQEQLISFKTAKLAKEKGFNLLVNSYFRHPGVSTQAFTPEKNHRFSEITNGIRHANFNKKASQTSRPSQSLLQKWLREKHLLDIDIQKHFSVYNLTSITFYDEVNDVNVEQSIEKGIEWKDFRTYEQALEKGLQEALKLI